MATRNPSLNIRPDVKVQAKGERAVAAVAAHAADDDELRGPRGDWWYTGLPPSQCPGYSEEDGCLRALPMPCLRGFDRQSVIDYFDNTWTMTEVLLACLQGNEAFYRQPYHQLRHPMIFYYGHPAVLYINKFRVAGLLQDPINQWMEQLLETGVDEMSWDDLSQGRDDWPGVRQVTEYRRACYKVVRELLASHPCLDAPEVGWEDPAWAIFMCLEHERIHIETSSVLIRELPLDFVRYPEYFPPYHPSALLPSPALPREGEDYPQNKMLTVQGESVVLGKPLEYPSFGWDNEYGRKAIDVQGFSASQFKVSNGEFLQFVKAGGYASLRYWSKDGWGWRTFRNVKYPTFWVLDGPQGLHRYKLRALFSAIDMRWDWPVDVCYHEARAYCAWRTEVEGQSVKYRLITEAEHQLIRNARDRVDAYRLAGPQGQGQGQGQGQAAAADGEEDAVPPQIDPLANVDMALFVGGRDAEAKVGANLQLAHASAGPVNALPPSQKGFHDTFGGVWEWAEDHYAAYPGFRVHPYYDDFSAPCFAGLHQLILGGSFISTGHLASKYARYQFRPHFFQHAGFRLVQTVVEDFGAYDMERYGPHNPLVPFYETSCMDAAPPYVGSGPCCSASRRSAFTPSLAEERKTMAQQHRATQGQYETSTYLAQYLSLHYGPAPQVYPLGGLGADALLLQCMNYPAKVAQRLIDWAKKAGCGSARALDVGCSVGCSTFSLASHFAEVVGVDISKAALDAATKLKEQGALEYECKVEGDLTERLTAALTPEQSAAAPRTRFLQGDALALPPDLGQDFDAALLANVIDRVPDPGQCLAQVAERLAKGGLLLVVSPFSWLEEHTDRRHWLGGTTTQAEGLPVRSADALRSLLTSSKLGFEVLEEGQQPLLIREHCRKFQLILAHSVVLRKL